MVLRGLRRVDGVNWGVFLGGFLGGSRGFDGVGFGGGEGGVLGERKRRRSVPSSLKSSLLFYVLKRKSGVSRSTKIRRKRREKIILAPSEHGSFSLLFR